MYTSHPRGFIPLVATFLLGLTTLVGAVATTFNFASHVPQQSHVASSTAIAKQATPTNLTPTRHIIATGNVAPKVSSKKPIIDFTPTVTQSAKTVTVTPTQFTQAQSSEVNSAPPNTTPCNGTNWNACPTGQNFVCPANGGKAYCQAPLPAPTATQLAGIQQFCNFAKSQGDTDVTQLCTSGELLKDYEGNNATFRSTVDADVAKLQQNLAASQQQSNNAAVQAAEINNASQSASQTSFQLEQLQQAVTANTQAINEQKAQQQQQAFQQQHQQESQQYTNTPKTYCGEYYPAYCP